MPLRALELRTRFEQCRPRGDKPSASLNTVGDGPILALRSWSSPSNEPPRPLHLRRAHMEFLAGDALSGRRSGTRNEWLAVVYIGSNLKRWGVAPLGDNGGYVQGRRDDARRTLDAMWRARERTADAGDAAGTAKGRARPCCCPSFADFECRDPPASRY